MRPRTIMLTVAVVSLGGFLFLTVYAAIDRGFTVLTVLSVFIVFLMTVGIIGALFEHPPDDE
jgi:hypothetical protein